MNITIMTKHTLILVSLLLAGIPDPQAQIIQQQYIECEVHGLTVDNYNTVNVMIGDQNMIRVKDSHDNEGNVVTISNGVIKVSEDGFSTVELVVKPGTLSYVEATEFGSVSIPLMALSDKALLRATEHGKLTTSSVTAKGDDGVGADMASAAAPSLFTDLTLESNEFGTLKVKHAASCTRCYLTAREYGSIDLVELNGNTAEVYAEEFGNVRVKGGTMDTVRVRHGNYGNVDVSGMKITYHPVNPLGPMARVAGKDVGTPQSDIRKPNYRHIYDPSSRYSFAFYFGWGMWGEAPYSSFISMDGAWGSKPKFMTCTFEGSYAVMRHYNWMFQVGLGIAVDGVKLSNNYVFVSEQSNGNGVLTVGNNASIASYGDLSGDLTNPYLWQTRVTAEYITLPLRFARTNSENDYSIGISLVPGVAIVRNVQHIILNEKVNGRSVDYRNSEQANHYLNPVKLDLRLDAVLRDALGVFLQTGLLPMTRNLDDEAFMFSFGFRAGF